MKNFTAALWSAELHRPCSPYGEQTVPRFQCPGQITDNRIGNTMRWFRTSGQIFPTFPTRDSEVFFPPHQNSVSPRRDAPPVSFGDAASSFILPPKLPLVSESLPKSWQSSGLLNLWKEPNVSGPRKVQRRWVAAGVLGPVLWRIVCTPLYANGSGLNTGSGAAATREPKIDSLPTATKHRITFKKNGRNSLTTSGFTV